MPRKPTLMPNFNEEVVKIRGVDYRLQELSIGEYDDLVKLSTSTKTNPITGAEEDEVDNIVLLKFMVLKCVIEPKLNAEKLASLPMRVVLKLNQTVNKMHYGEEPAEDVKKGDDDEPEEEEESKGND